MNRLQMCVQAAQQMILAALRQTHASTLPPLLPHPARRHHILTLRPQREKATANQNIWPWWKWVNLCFSGCRGTMASSFPLLATHSRGRQASVGHTPQPCVAALIPAYAATPSWARLPVILIYLWFYFRHTRTSRSSVPSAQSAGAPARGRTPQPSGLVALGCQTCFSSLPLLWKRTGSWTRLVCYNQNSGPKNTPAKLLQQLLQSDLRVNTQIFLFYTYDCTRSTLNVWKSLKRINSSVDCSSA